MPVVFLIAIAVVLVGIFFAATGRGGELAYEHADHAPLDLGPVSAADIALLRPPTAMWGYNMQVTDAALDQIARAMRERDVTIAYLQEQLAGYARNGSYPGYPEYAEPRGAHARQADEAVEPSGILQTPGPPTIPDPLEPGALLVKITASTLCGTDVHRWHGPLPDGDTLPIITGHEPCGIVEAINGDRTDILGKPVKPGDRTSVRTP